MSAFSSMIGKEDQLLDSLPSVVVTSFLVEIDMTELLTMFKPYLMTNMD